MQLTEPIVGEKVADVPADSLVLGVAITNCPNFGNPYNPEVYYQFVHAVKGMGEACRKFNTPFTGGNVSFYNQSVFKDRTEPVYPTPTIGMLGILDHYEQQTTLEFKAAGHHILLLGESRNDINSSEYLRSLHGVAESPVPYFDLEKESALQEVIRSLIFQRQIQSAHDVSEGGLFVTLMESAMAAQLGFDVQTSEEVRRDAFLFGESQSRAVITVTASDLAAVQNYLAAQHIPFKELGQVTDRQLIIDGQDFGHLNDWRTTYNNTLGQAIEK